MASASTHRLIVNADDFGVSSPVNRAVVQAHRDGILTTASLMVTGEAAEEAVELARENPSLGVGLHLTLCRGRPALPPGELPDLTDASGRFSENPVMAGLTCFLVAGARRQIEREVEAQFERFEETGLKLDHINGHLHFHLHPVVFGVLAGLFARFRVRAVRLMREPWEENFLRERGRWGYRVSHAAIFSLLARRAGPALERAGIVSTDRVYGLLQHGLMDEARFLQLVKNLPRGTSEVYAHPSLREPGHEFDALVSPRVKKAIAEGGVQLIRYEDLWSSY